jgi:hypothetical protein
MELKVWRGKYAESKIVTNGSFKIRCYRSNKNAGKFQHLLRDMLSKWEMPNVCMNRHALLNTRKPPVYSTCRLC